MREGGVVHVFQCPVGSYSMIFLSGLVVRGKGEVLLSWRGTEGGDVVHVFQCPIGSYSMLFLSGSVVRGNEEV